MPTPIIGICSAFEVARWGFWAQQAALVPGTYLSKVHAAGGLPIGLIPDERAATQPDILLDRIDGLMLIGGVDVEPSSYGGTKSDRTEATEPRRDAFELALTRAAMRRDIPILGICRGLQVLNVAAGGTLHEHLLDEGYNEHRPSPGRLDGATFHDVEVEIGTLAASMIGSGVQTVNSHHHQGIDALGNGAIVSAHSVPDRLPEAIEWPSCGYVLGVQWHPESADLGHALSDFVRAAAKSAERSPRV